MLRRALISVLLSVCLVPASMAASGVETPDSTAFAALDAKLDEYMAALEREPVDVKCTETDFIISSCTDSAVTARVAGRVYEHYRDSKLMGDDAVAVHVFDRWFADGTVKMADDATFFAAEFFARTNRNSLIGCMAPRLELYSPQGETVILFGTSDGTGDNGVGDGDCGDSAEGAAGRYSILFFYDVGCPKCLVESMILRNVLEDHDYDLVLYAIYVGSDAAKWEEYRAERFKIDSPHLRTVHLWDPELTSGFTLEYGVVSTPKIFLVDPDGVIAGRGLDGTSLEKLLSVVFTPETLEYGSEESKALYDKTFEDTPDSDCEAVSDVAEHIASMLLPRRDTLLYRQMTGDLLYYVTSRKEAKFKCGAESFIDRYILARGDIWKTQDDSLKVVSLALFLKDLLNLCPVGEGLPDITVPAEVLSRRGGAKKLSGDADEAAIGRVLKSAKTDVNLSGLKNCAVLFYTEGCSLCDAQRSAARSLIAFRTPVPGTDIVPSSVIMVDMDEVWCTDGPLPDYLMQHFDLSSLPFALVVDSAGRVAHKYVSLQ